MTDPVQPARSAIIADGTHVKKRRIQRILKKARLAGRQKDHLAKHQPGRKH
jgi:hypothetical protein